MRRAGTRVDGGKLKINENGEMYIERRGRKPGPRSRKSFQGISLSPKTPKKQPPTRHLDSTSNSDELLSRRNQAFKYTCPSKNLEARLAFQDKDNIWYKNTNFSIGAIVSLTDTSDNQPYFGQIYACYNDPVMQGFVFITWLAPKYSAADPHTFEAKDFAHAFADHKRYPIECCTWICTRPEIASYQYEQTVQMINADKKAELLRRRWRDLNDLAREELRRHHQKSLLSFSAPSVQ